MNHVYFGFVPFGLGLVVGQVGAELAPCDVLLVIGRVAFKLPFDLALVVVLVFFDLSKQLVKRQLAHQAILDVLHRWHFDKLNELWRGPNAENEVVAFENVVRVNVLCLEVLLQQLDLRRKQNAGRIELLLRNYRGGLFDLWLTLVLLGDFSDGLVFSSF